MERRNFLLKAGGLLAAVGAAVTGCRQDTKPQDAPQVITKRKHQ